MKEFKRISQRIIYFIGLTLDNIRGKQSVTGRKVKPADSEIIFSFHFIKLMESLLK